MKRQRHIAGDFHQEHRPHMKTRLKLPSKKCTIAEPLVKPCLLKILFLGEAREVKMRQISLSSNTIQRRISDVLDDVKDQVINEMKASPMFSFQVVDSTDVTSCAQLLKSSFVRNCKLQQVRMFWRSKPFLILQSCSRICLWGCYSWSSCNDWIMFRLSETVQELAPEANVTHYVIHRWVCWQNFTYSEKWAGFEDKNYIKYMKSGSLNTCLFKELCKDIFPTHEVLLFHTSVSWLLKGNVLNGVFQMNGEIKLYPVELKPNEFLSTL